MRVEKQETPEVPKRVDSPPLLLGRRGQGEEAVGSLI